MTQQVLSQLVGCLVGRHFGGPYLLGVAGSHAMKPAQPEETMNQESYSGGTVLVLDLSGRRLLLSTASVTEVISATVPDGGDIQGCQGGSNKRQLVLRFGVEIGKLAEVMAAQCSPTERGLTLMMPVLLVGRYKAMSSEGHAYYLPAMTAIWQKVKMSVVGAIGYDFRGWSQRPSGLWKFREPVEAVLLPAGTVIRTVRVHGNSNHATAQAVVDGVAFMVSTNRDIVYVVEGQSDRESVWSFSFDQVDRAKFNIGFPAEHRTDIFGGSEVSSGDEIKTVESPV